MISDYYLNNWMMSSGNVLCICGITGIQRPKGPPSPTKLRCSPYSHDFKPHIVNIWNTAHMIQNQHWEKRKSLWVLQTLFKLVFCLNTSTLTQVYPFHCLAPQWYRICTSVLHYCSGNASALQCQHLSITVSTPRYCSINTSVLQHQYLNIAASMPQYFSINTSVF